MKRKLLEVAVKERLFSQISLLGKVLVIAVLLAPIAAVIITNQLVQSSIMGAYEISSINTVPSPLQAKITVSEPAWFAANAPAPSALGFSLTKGYAPFPVFFQGWESTVREEIIDYEWNFGDSGAMGNNLNILKGFNSAHVFEQPGIYNVTLTVKNRQGQISRANISIEVVARPEAKKYYVDYAIGDDAYTGLCQTVSGTCGPWKTAEKVFVNLHNKYSYGTSVLFKRGGSYPITTVTSSAVFIEGTLFGAYGEGAKPIIEYAGSVNTGIMINLANTSRDISFTDLDFRFKNAFSSARLGGLVRGTGLTKRLLLLRFDATDMNSNLFGFSYVKNTADPAKDESIMTGVYVFDSTIKLNYYGRSTNDPGFVGAEMFYGFMGNMALVGNTFDKSFNHIAYLSHLNKAVVINNTFGRPAYGRNALRVSGNIVNGQGTNNVYIADNYFLGWRDPIPTGQYADNGGDPHNGGGTRYNDQLISISPNTSSDQSIKNVIFERNILTNFEKAVLIADAENIIVRNNLFVTPNLNGRTSGALNIGDRTYEYRPSKNITVVGNTFALQGLSMLTAALPDNPSAAIFIAPYNRKMTATPPLEHELIKIYNNLFYRPANSSAIVIAINYKTAALMPQLQFDGNLYYDQAAVTGKMFIVGVGKAISTSSQYTLAGWQNLGFNYDLHSQAQVMPIFNQTPAFASNGLGAPLTLDENLRQADAYKEMFRLSNDPANPAIDKGVNVNNYLHYDFTRNERPDGSLANGTNYDVGAYEITKVPAPPIAACVENWSCASYQPTVCDASRIQTRICSDANNCGTVVNKPLESQSCTYIPPCVENWTCTAFSSCSSGSQSRTCSDSNQCGTIASKPTLTQGCTSACSPNWACTSWPACTSSGLQSRTCTDSNNCNIITGKPSESQSCTYSNAGGGGGGGSGGGGSGAVTPPSGSPSVPNFDSVLSVVVSTQGSIVKVNASDRPAVYYVVGGKKYLFVNRVTYTSWSANAGDSANNFSTLKKISQAEFDNIPTGGNLVVKATWLIKFDDSPIVYAVGSGGKLYKLADLAAQKALFGSYAPAVIQSGFRDNYYDHGNSVGTLTASSPMPQ